MMILTMKMTQGTRPYIVFSHLKEINFIKKNKEILFLVMQT